MAEGEEKIPIVTETVKYDGERGIFVKVKVPRTEDGHTTRVVKKNDTSKKIVASVEKVKKEAKKEKKTVKTPVSKVNPKGKGIAAFFSNVKPKKASATKQGKVDDEEPDSEEDFPPNQKSGRRSARKKKPIIEDIVFLDDDEEMDSDGTEEEKKDMSEVIKKRKRGSSLAPKKTLAPKKRSAAKSDNAKSKQVDRDVSDGEFSLGDEDSDDESIDQDEFDSDSDEEEIKGFVVVDSSEDEEFVAKPKAKAKKVVRTKKEATSAKKEKPTSAKPAEDTGKKRMADSFAPINTPIYNKLSMEEIAKTKEFLDPCGMEATDDIIDQLIGDQVDKIGNLLLRSIGGVDSDGDPNMESVGGFGSKNNLLKLATACSGTDAPSLALTLIQEQMEIRGLKKEDDRRLEFSHEFSCEVDPFKQAYLARNFDSILYPDIVRLIDKPGPTDVYGQTKVLPAFNMFVAGTSCKNFSMLRSKFRIDIEDRGCSGETFMGATEVLFDQKPEIAIFENVTGAPWEKMSEYITGRVKLSSCDEKKAISNIKQNIKDLSFAYDAEINAIVVDQVPGVYGVRVGSAVKGFHKPGSDEVKEITWPSTISKSKKSCTLAQLMKANGITKKTDTLVLDTPCTYCTHAVKVDTKEYGLPQTRMRTYMIVWRPKDNDIHDDLGYYMEAIVKYLKAPVRHSLEAFILNDDHEIIRRFREALNGPAGRKTKSANMQEADFWTSSNANLPHNKNSRAALGLKDMARFLTCWGPYGKKQIPPHYWTEYINCYTQRQVDMLDILHGSAIRDAESHDSNFSSFYWNISQNATKEKHRSATSGIAGCVTPGGDFVLPHKGRPLLGCEKLLVQGLPYFRLALQNETEVQLGDLAGNAMSLTVVSACMLGAILAEQARKDLNLTPIKQNATPKQKKDFVQKIIDCLPKLAPLSKSEVATSDEVAATEIKSLEADSSDCAMKIFKDLAALADNAINSSVLCTCESSGRNSKTEEFVQCTVCRVSCCRECLNDTIGYNLSSHKTEEFVVSSIDHDNGRFQTKLRSALPASLYLDNSGLKEIESVGCIDAEEVSNLANSPFNLHRIKRDRRKWIITYYARRNDVGEATAELRITVGDLKRLDAKSHSPANTGALVELTSFLPARSSQPRFGQLSPIAIINFDNESTKEAIWTARSPTEKVALTVRGEGSTDSPRITVGLEESIMDDLKATAASSYNAKAYSSACAKGENRRWIYPKNWTVWPQSIFVESDNESILAGQYERVACEQTINMNALWIREASKGRPVLYLMIKPNVSRTGPDTAIITSSIGYETTFVLAEFPPFWQPCDSLVKAKEIVKGVKFHSWKQMEKVKCTAQIASVEVEVKKCLVGDDLIVINKLTERQCKMMCQRIECDDDVLKLPIHSGQRAQQIIRVFNAVCVSAMQRQMASGGLNFGLVPDKDGWHELRLDDKDTPFGTCEMCVPYRPAENWIYDEVRKRWDRNYESGVSRKFRLSLQNAPTPFEVWVNRQEHSLSIKLFPRVAAHYVGRQIIDGRNIDAKGINVKFHFTDISLQEDPVIDPFKVRTCQNERPTDITLKEPFSLYERQRKVVTKMVSIENAETDFKEMEMVENPVYGSSGLSLTTVAERATKLRGGVIADAIGAGKTIVSIGLILNGLQNARSSRKFPSSTSATLVVVPPALLRQWQLEIERFSPTTLKILVIYDFLALKKLSLQKVLDADVVLVPIDILESKGYFENLVGKAKLNKAYTQKLPKLPSHSGQKEINEARGVWIPATSADPYAGSNNSTNQQNRNISAFYTHVYHEAIRKIRDEKTTTIKKTDTGVPLEFFQWERVIVDEIHESLCTTKSEIDEAKERDGKEFFKERNRRAGREFLGITVKDILKRPLVYRKAIFGLSGTPLLDSTSRVIELANLMGNAYVLGLSSHWRRLEKESSRDIFLENYLEPVRGREVRTAAFRKCQDYLNVACCRNKVDDEEMNGSVLETQIRKISMSAKEKELYLSSMKGIPEGKRSLAIRPEDFEDVSPGSFAKFLKQNASLRSRGAELVSICKEVLADDPITKIIVFTDGSIDAGIAACSFLKAEKDLGCTSLLPTDSNELKNKKISWYQHGDVTDEDKARPRILVLHYEHCAGLNLQTECSNLILFGPLYTGTGGTNSDPVSDASSELQAIGRVYRAGQTKKVVNVYKIIVDGPEGEEILDGLVLRRNTDTDTLAMATNAGD